MGVKLRKIDWAPENVVTTYEGQEIAITRELSPQVPEKPSNGSLSLPGSSGPLCAPGWCARPRVAGAFHRVWGPLGIGDPRHRGCKGTRPCLPFFVKQAFLGAFNWVGSVCSLNIFIFSHHCLQFHWENKYCMSLLPALFS